MAAMNFALVIINTYFIVKLLRERHDDTVYAGIEVDEGDDYLARFVDTHSAEIRHLFPEFFAQVTDASGAITVRDDRYAYLIVSGDETAGAVVVSDAGDGVAQVELDYVTPKYRDFTPGEFVYRKSGLFRTGISDCAHPGWHGGPVLREAWFRQTGSPLEARFD